MAFAAHDSLGTFLESGLEIARHTRQLLLADQRSHLRLGIHSRTKGDLFRLLRDAFNYFVKCVFLDIETRSGAAALTMIEENGHGSSRNSFAHVGVFEDDVGRFATQFERYLLQIAGCSLED